jgi:hypothetical protein
MQALFPLPKHQEHFQDIQTTLEYNTVMTATMMRLQRLTRPVTSRIIKPPVLQRQFHLTPKYLGPTATALASETGSNHKLGALGQTASGERLHIRTYPQFNNLEDERLYRKQHLAAAFRVFAERGYDEGVAGHISKFERERRSVDGVNC